MAIRLADDSNIENLMLAPKPSKPMAGGLVASAAQRLLAAITGGLASGDDVPENEVFDALENKYRRMIALATK